MDHSSPVCSFLPPRHQHACAKIWRRKNDASFYWRERERQSLCFKLASFLPFFLRSYRHPRFGITVPPPLPVPEQEFRKFRFFRLLNSGHFFLCFVVAETGIIPKRNSGLSFRKPETRIIPNLDKQNHVYRKNRILYQTELYLRRKEGGNPGPLTLVHHPLGEEYS